MGIRLSRRWAALPLWARWIGALYVVGFADGTGAHARALAADGLHAYSSFWSAPIRVFLLCLIVIDPAVALLMVLLRPAGVWLAAIVMCGDIGANWLGNWPFSPGFALRGLGLISAFGLFVLASALPLLRAVRAIDRRAAPMS
jgi:hypothetical protein